MERAGCLSWHSSWRVRCFNWSPAFSEHVPIMFTPTSLSTLLLNMCDTKAWWEFDQTSSSRRESLACETKISRLPHDNHQLYPSWGGGGFTHWCRCRCMRLPSLVWSIYQAACQIVQVVSAKSTYVKLLLIRFNAAHQTCLFNNLISVQLPWAKFPSHWPWATKSN